MSKIDSTQIDVIINAINMILKDSNLEIISLIDLNDGMKIPSLVQTILNEKIERLNYKIKNKAMIYNNNSTVIQFLSRKNPIFSSSQFDSEDNLARFAYHLLNIFYIATNNQNLIKRINSILQDFHPIKNLKKSWRNGLPFIALLSKISKEQIEYDDKRDPDSNYQLIKNEFQSLNIPFILTPQCIVSDPEEFCIRLQASIFLKYIEINNIEVERANEEDQTNSQIENARIRLHNYITKYDIESKNALDIILNELQEIENANTFESYETVQKKSAIYKIFKSENGKEQKCINHYNEARTLWEYITNVSRNNNIEIPSVFVNFDELNEKYCKMMKIFQCWGNNLHEESERMKNYENELLKVKSLEDAEKLINKLNEFYDMNNWQNYHIKSIIYRAGIVLEDQKREIEKHIQEQRNYYQQNISLFNKTYDKCLLELSDENYEIKYETIYIDMKPLSNSISCIQNALEKLNGKSKNNELEIQDLNEKIKYIEKLAYQYKTNQLLKNCENEFTKLLNECDKYRSYVKSSVEKNEYSLDVYKNQKEFFYIYIETPKTTSFIDAFNLIENKNLCKHTIDDAYKEISNYTKEIYNALDILKQRETFSYEIEKVSNETLEILNGIKYTTLSSTIQQFINAKKALTKLQNIKNWPENSVGSSINVYNKSISNCDNIFNTVKGKILSMFNSDIKRIYNSLTYTKQNYIKETEHPEKDDISFDIGLDNISNSYIKMKTLFFVNDEMNYDRKKELDDIMTDLGNCESQIMILKSKIHDRVFKKLNENRVIILNIINEMKKIENDFVYDNSHLNELNFDYLDNKCYSVNLQFKKIRYSEKWMINNNSKYGFDAEIPDTQNTINFLRDLVIFYQSKFMLKPLLTPINDIYNKSKDPILSLSAAYIYVNEFSNRKFTFSIENDISQVKKSFESFMFSDPSFIEKVIKKIQNEIKQKTKDLDYDLLIELEIFADALQYIPNFKYSLITSAIPYLQSRYDSYDIVKKLQEIESCSISNTLIFIAKDYIPIVEERKNHYINNDPTIIIDLGSYNVRNAFSYKGVITADEQAEKVYKSFIEELTELITKMLGYKNVSKTYQTIFKILDKYKDKLYELVDDRDEKVTLFITSRKFDLKTEDFISKVFNSYDFINNIAFIDPSVGIVTYFDDSGIAVDIGDSCLSITPVLNRKIVPNCRIVTEQGGRKIAMEFQENLEPIGLEKNQIKRIRCLDEFRHDKSKIRLSEYEDVDDDINIPDLTVHGKSRKAILTPENVLFNRDDSLTNLIINAAKEASMFTKRDVNIFLLNIALAGGASNINGLKKRLLNELREKYPKANVYSNSPELLPLYGALDVTHSPEFYKEIIEKSNFSKKFDPY